MRRLAAAVMSLAAVAVALMVAIGSPANGADVYRVDALFDTAKGVIPGQLVKIAGAPVGTIEDVVLTEDYEARVQLSVEQRFAPFRSDAHCEIQPEGLISENFVQCDPGRDGEPLAGSDEVAPTVPVENTSAAVSIMDLFKIFRAPVRQRFAIISASLGLGLSARGEDLNEVLRRANPALAEVRRITNRLARQREEIGTLVDASDRLIAELADRRDRVTDFIDQADRVTAQTADHSSQLQATIHNLPALLDEIDPTIERIRTLSGEARPLLADLRASAPGLERLLAEVPAFAAAGRPALTALGRVADTGRATIRTATPTVDLLRRFAAAALPTGQMLDPLLVNLRDRGFVEGLLSFTYHVMASTARYDETSHFLPAHLRLSMCSGFATAPVAGCSANYNQTSATTEGQRADEPQRPAAKLPDVPDLDDPKPSMPRIPGLPELPELPLPALPPAIQDAIDEVLEESDVGGGRPPISDLTDYLFG